VDSRDALEREVEACLAAALPEVDLLELTVIGRGEEGYLRVVVDHPDGVGHDLCEAVTRALQAEGLGDRYGIEVWSPGPEPPMRLRRHYRRALGHRVRLRVEDGGRVRSREGTLEAVGEEGVSLTTATGLLEIPFGAIRRANDLEGGHRC
jgi:ribosome maturation factor RimP